MSAHSHLTLDMESEVRRRYAEGANEVQPGLCCPTSYDPRYLAVLPNEIIEKDYGCGDPTVHVNEGEIVLDLGAGVGKACYILSQRVGSKGKVIGVDFNNAMLVLARKHMDAIAGKTGYYNVRFVRARIQDLALDLDAAQGWLNRNYVTQIEDFGAYDAECTRLRRECPAIPSDSVDVVVSNCVLNLVRAADKERMFGEIFRVVKVGGRAVISDIVCDEEPTERIKNDPELWSGCIAGAIREDRFVEMFIDAGFYGCEIIERKPEAWQTIDGIEFRSITVRAFKGKQGPCLERNQAVIYRGPWKSVTDDDGHTFHRGRRTAVCDKTYGLMTRSEGPYHRDLAPVPPRVEVPLASAGPFDCTGSTLRPPRATKGMDYREDKSFDAAGQCGPKCC